MLTKKQFCVGLVLGTLMIPAGVASASAQEIPNDFSANRAAEAARCVAITAKQLYDDQASLNDFLDSLDSRGLGTAQPQIRKASGSGS
ncbi:hypothetical protein [Mesorhizobium sp. 113-3-3]|uniref:hypothetical protein n=1 Tax=Mesorhizobium sp. 113-3-3 TaxID=2744516 RepID=UPI001934DA1B|nr:hypothetical protein [Mesorhizobium sp. 113-3-3]BCG83740.1 hypothetical protein MesoLj113b_72820 [Mesorhizobium sp. 113-3-3]